MSVSFCKMIGELAQQSELASPTTFHRLMQYLDSTGQLFRVFTQNIDCLEAKCGISFGLPSLGLDVNTGPRQVRVRKRQASTWDLPRCIPLHGRIDSVHCVLCHQSYAIGHYINTFLSGVFPVCDLCQDVKTLRPFTNKRSRGVGNLRPSIVLYNETHSSADVIGEAIARDLKEVCAHDVDVVLLVVGTSLQIPSVKTMVRQFARKLHTHKDRSAMRSIYLNMEFPAASSEWGGVFDAWIYGDVQEFACAILTSMGKV
jgi:NAD-dependent SIR2 family protein deacetylase